ncbi:MAG: bifunctional diguanylate cyclase/phosphodiesterase [Nitrospirota bacterium]
MRIGLPRAYTTKEDRKIPDLSLPSVYLTIFDPSSLYLVLLFMAVGYCVYLYKSLHDLRKRGRMVDDLRVKERREKERREKNSKVALQDPLTAKTVQEKTADNLIAPIEDKSDFLAGQDSLTRLPNRRVFLDRLDQTLLRIPWQNRYLGVCCLSIDAIREVSDTLGYEMRNLLFAAIGERLSSSLRAGDTIAHMDGDGFAILCVDVAKGSDMTKVVQTILGDMSKPFFIRGQELFSTVTIGISLSPDDGNRSEILLQHADIALSRAKKRGRNQWEYYSKEFNQSMIFQTEMENSLRHALERNELELYYQPKLDLISNTIISFEALIRWRHPRLGFVHPKEFIPIAEDMGLIVPIGEWVIMAACKACKDWHDQGFSHISVSVNLSARQCHLDVLASQVERILHRYNLNPSFLELELTESLEQYSKEAEAVISKLSEMGVAIGVDDFGTGFSSMTYFKQFPISFIKVDQSFISGIPIDPSDIAITTAIIQLGQSLHMKVIAEGVEEPDQLAFLRKMKCDMVQGYLIEKPMPHDRVIQYLKEKEFYVAQ